MRRLLFLILFLFPLGIGLYVNHLSHYREVFRSICDLTEDHFFRENFRLAKWLRECHSRAEHIPSRLSVDQLLANIQDVMNEMEVSHFQIYSPVEDRRLWKGESIDTGIHSRFVEDHLIVYRVYAESPAAKADIRPGDDIVAIEGADQLSPWGAQHRSGKFVLRRMGKEYSVSLSAREFVTDSSPRVMDLGHGVGLVELASFRSEFFAREDWRKTARSFMKYPYLIVDLRENAGGNFVAMLRALSSFRCGGRSVGVLLQPRKDAPVKAAFDDDTADDYQIRQLDRFRSLGLETFFDYGCYKGKVTVLIGPDTSSVAEIFAHSFFSRPGSRVWGQPTAGDVVLAVWYDLPALGPGFSVSIPEAIYLTPEKKELEGKGVWPQKELYFDLSLSLQGKDSWIAEALHY